MEDKLGKESKKEIKTRWKNQYKELENIVNAWDPLGFICGGAPEDEYDCLSTQILSLLYRGKQEDEIKSFIIKELRDHFGLSVDDLKTEYRQRYINGVNDFSNIVFRWFSKYRNVDSGEY